MKKTPGTPKRREAAKKTPIKKDGNKKHEHQNASTDTPLEGGRKVTFAIITVSDTRTEATDLSGKLAIEILKSAGHHVANHRVVKDEKHQIREAIQAALSMQDVEIVFLTGGTGISPRDTTSEAVGELLDKTLPGFGELFRQLSFFEIGTATILSRASGGVAQGKAIFSAPGSRGAVKLALEKIIIPESGHIVNELRKGTAQ
ncbi:MAG: molybdenum cofactor biosynthesis protein B [Planctomycetota bacterium]